MPRLLQGWYNLVFFIWDTLLRFIQFKASSYQELRKKYSNPDSFLVVSADNIDFTHSYAQVFSGNQQSSWHGTTIQLANPLPSLSELDVCIDAQCLQDKLSPAETPMDPPGSLAQFSPVETHVNPPGSLATQSLSGTSMDPPGSLAQFSPTDPPGSLVQLAPVETHTDRAVISISISTKTHMLTNAQITKTSPHWN